MSKIQVTVSARDGQLPGTVVQTIQSKAEKLPRFHNRITGVNVVVQLGNPDRPGVDCRVTVEEAGEFFATDTGHNVVAALDSVLRKIEQQLKKHKEKLTDHRSDRDSQGVI